MSKGIQVASRNCKKQGNRLSSQSLQKASVLLTLFFFFAAYVHHLSTSVKVERSR